MTQAPDNSGPTRAFWVDGRRVTAGQTVNPRPTEPAQPVDESPAPVVAPAMPPRKSRRIRQ